ncbi:MAG: sulfite exporter TauE/SafE family protein [Candidatus Phosphoribacter sp.]|nr:sulfite exporter TauE/SafE family protein [Actinomycetales bacterium]
MTWLAAPLGVLTGAVMGALGGGGAILTIPVLIYLLGFDPHAATTASLVIVGVSALAAVPAHLRHRTARVGDALVLAIVGVLGTYAGSLASAAVPSEVLVVLLGSLLAVVGALMLRHSPDSGADADPPPLLGSARQLAKVVAVGSGVGLLTGFFGVGGGFAIVPALTLVLGYPVRLAVGTSLAVITLNSASAFVSRLGNGVVLDWGVIALFTIGAVAGSLVGGAIGRRTSASGLSQSFAVLLFLVAAFMLVSAVLSR